MFNFTYAIINVVLGYVAGALGHGYNPAGLRSIGTVIVIGAVIFTWIQFTFGWAVITFIELMVGVALYGMTSKRI